MSIEQQEARQVGPDPLALAFVALTTLIGMQLIRALIPYFLNVLRDRLDMETTTAALVALLIFAAAFLAGPVNRFFGSIPALLFSAIVTSFTRLALQFWGYDPLGDFILAATGTAAFLIFLPIALGLARRMAGSATLSMGVGLLAGMALDLAINGLFYSYDLAWQSGWLPGLIVLAIVLAQWFLISRIVRGEQSGETADTGWPVGLSWLFIGPLIFLQLLIFGNFGWAVTMTGLSFSGAYALLLAGQVVGLALLALPGRPFRLLVLATALVAAAAGIALTTLGPSDPWLPILFLFTGQVALAGFTLAAMRRLGQGAPERGLLTLTLVGGVSFLILVVFLFVYYAGYDLALPFDNSLLPMISFAIVVLCGLPGLFSWPKEANLARTTARAAPALLALLLLPLAQWLLAPEPQAAAPDGGPLRIMVYNIHGGADPQGHIGLEAIARIIEQQDPDVVGLQEVSRGWILNGSMDTLTWLARRLDMVPFFGPAADAQWGNAVLTRLPVQQFENVPLPPESLLLKRAYMLLELDAGWEQPLTLINTHYHNPQDGGAIREEQSAVILDAWNGREATAVMGDFNAEHGMAEVDIYTATSFGDVLDLTGVAPGYTNPVPGPFRRIDYIFISPDLAASDGVVPQDEASDHLPVAATIIGTDND